MELDSKTRHMTFVSKVYIQLVYSVHRTVIPRMGSFSHADGSDFLIEFIFHVMFFP
jgi:hypothetical protein